MRRKMKTLVTALLSLSLCLQAVCQESSLQFGLSVSTVRTHRRGQTSVTEGGSLKICYKPTARPSKASVVYVRTKDGTAHAPEDYTSLDTNLTFTEADPQCIWLYANLDVDKEGSETFTIEASGTSGDYSNVNIEVTVTIRNQGLQGPSISIEHDNYPVPVGAGEVEVCAAYYGTQPLASDATVQLRTLENPMFPGPSPASTDDYTPVSKKLSFPAGSPSGTRRCITIKITVDIIVKNEETIQVAISALSLPHGVSISPLTSTTVRIIKTKTVIPPKTGSDGWDSGDGKGHHHCHHNQPDQCHHDQPDHDHHQSNPCCHHQSQHHSHHHCHQSHQCPHHPSQHSHHCHHYHNHPGNDFGRYGDTMDIDGGRNDVCSAHNPFSVTSCINLGHGICGHASCKH